MTGAGAVRQAGDRRPRFGLIGDPVAHSLSPAMHRAAFRELDLEAEYVAVRVAAEAPGLVAGAMRRLAASGGGKGGGNVTLPHKSAAALALDESTEAVRLTGACNCFWLDGGGRLHGDNTDVGGIRTVIESMRGLDPRGASILVLGAGGAAAAAVFAGILAGAARVRVRNRNVRRAAELVERFPGERVRLYEPNGSTAEFDLVVQATSLGLAPDDPLPLRFSGPAPAHALDLVYRPGGTPWVSHARAHGAKAEDGLRVLLEQGVLSLERWFGCAMSPSVRASMQRALDSSRS